MLRDRRHTFFLVVEPLRKPLELGYFFFRSIFHLMKLKLLSCLLRGSGMINPPPSLSGPTSKLTLPSWWELTPTTRREVNLCTKTLSQKNVLKWKKKISWHACKVFFSPNPGPLHTSTCHLFYYFFEKSIFIQIASVKTSITLICS